MKYLKKFENHTAYTAAESGLILPNVSLCVQENEVHYKPYVPTPPVQHDYVEIGGIKWATMNIGANSITDSGLYFQWGDTQGYTAAQVGSDKIFDWENYKYGNGTSSPGETGMTKYNSTDGKAVLDITDDAARANWGGGWRMPTSGEVQSLVSNASIEWVTDYQGSGVNGRLATSFSDPNKKLFFPAVGCALNDSIMYANSSGDYWNSTLFRNAREPFNPYYESANAFQFSSNSNFLGEGYRYLGYTVRAVLDE